MKNTTMAKQQWGLEELITALHVALRKHGRWGRLSVEPRDGKSPALLNCRAL